MRKQIFQKIYNIINIDSKQKFESETLFLKEAFLGHKCNDYFEDIIGLKEKWAIFLIGNFTAASNTTQRAESINSQLKRYYKGPKELNHLFDFIDIHYENASLKYKGFTKSELGIIEKLPILKHFKENMFDFSLKLIATQYFESQKR